MKIPGLSAAVVMDQELVWAKGFGYADLENQIEATLDTSYHLASVTKAIAATLIMQLVEEGVIRLDDPISNFAMDLADCCNNTDRGLCGSVAWSTQEIRPYRK